MFMLMSTLIFIIVKYTMWGRRELNLLTARTWQQTLAKEIYNQIVSAIFFW